MLGAGVALESTFSVPTVVRVTAAAVAPVVACGCSGFDISALSAAVLAVAMEIGPLAASFDGEAAVNGGKAASVVVGALKILAEGLGNSAGSVAVSGSAAAVELLVFLRRRILGPSVL